jgi:hypothetical protein
VHAAPLPPPHLIRVALLALLLTAAMLLALGELSAIDLGFAGGGSEATVPATEAPAPTIGQAPWLNDPLAAPSLELAAR